MLHNSRGAVSSDRNHPVARETIPYTGEVIQSILHEIRHCGERE